MRILLGVMALALIFVIGCGSARPTPFSEKVKPLGQAMEKAVLSKNKADVQKVYDLAAKRADVRKEELAVFKAVNDDVMADKWESATDLISKSNAIETD